MDLKSQAAFDLLLIAISAGLDITNAEAVGAFTLKVDVRV